MARVAANLTAPNSATINEVQKKIFWITFAALSLVADLVLPFWWAVAATIPILYAGWWIAYRSDWF